MDITILYLFPSITESVYSQYLKYLTRIFPPIPYIVAISLVRCIED